MIKNEEKTLKKIIISAILLIVIGFGINYIYNKNKNESNPIEKVERNSENEIEDVRNTLDNKKEIVSEGTAPWAKNENDKKQENKQGANEDLLKNIDVNALKELSNKINALTDQEKEDPLKVAKIIDELQSAAGSTILSGVKLDVISSNLKITDKIMKESKKMQETIKLKGIENMNEKDITNLKDTHIKTMVELSKNIESDMTVKKQDIKK